MNVIPLIAFLVLSYSLSKNIVKLNYIELHMQLAIILFICSKVNAITFCEKSTMTIKYVEKCPTDAKSWKIAAEKMNCESIEHHCSDSFNTGRHQFQYHCVINAWRNATLEVCAPNRTILGYCTEYNIHGTVIQDNYGADCTKLTRHVRYCITQQKLTSIKLVMTWWEEIVCWENALLQIGSILIQLQIDPVERWPYQS